MKRPLRIAAPKLYELFLQAAEKFRIHPHDVDASAEREGDELVLTLRYANGFTQQATFRIRWPETDHPHIAMDTRPEGAVLFFEETLEQCKKQLIADYYKMVVS